MVEIFPKYTKKNARLKIWAKIYNSLYEYLYFILTDYSQGFGGKFGVQTDRQDKSAAGWDHIEKVEKHESQKGELLARYDYRNGKQERVSIYIIPLIVRYMKHKWHSFSKQDTITFPFKMCTFFLV